jgi:hypothetical protein
MEPDLDATEATEVLNAAWKNNFPNPKEFREQLWNYPCLVVAWMHDHLTRLQEEIKLHATSGIADYQEYLDQLLKLLQKESKDNLKTA